MPSPAPPAPGFSCLSLHRRHARVRDILLSQQSANRHWRWRGNDRGHYVSIGELREGSLLRSQKA